MRWTPTANDVLKQILKQYPCRKCRVLADSMPLGLPCLSENLSSDIHAKPSVIPYGWHLQQVKYRRFAPNTFFAKNIDDVKASAKA